MSHLEKPSGVPAGAKWIVRKQFWEATEDNDGLVKTNIYNKAGQLAKTYYREGDGCISGIMTHDGVVLDPELAATEEDEQLFDAVIAGDLKAIKQLISDGIELEMTNEDGLTPLVLAADRGHLDIVKFLIEAGAQLHHISEGNNWTALLLAADKGHIEIAQHLIASGFNVKKLGGPASVHAILNDHNDIASLLLEHGVNPNFLYDDHIPLVSILADKNETELLKTYIDSGADLNLADNDEKTPVFYAVFGGNLEALILLVNNGANVHHKFGENQFDLLNRACAGQSAEIVSYLLDNGFSVENNSLDSQACMAEACCGGQIAIVDELVSRGLDVNNRSTNNDMALSMAVFSGHPELTEFLLSKGADIKAIDADGDGAMAAVFMKDHLDHLSWADRQNCMLQLLNVFESHNFDFDLPDAGWGFPPILKASYLDLDEVVAFLIEKGVDVNRVVSIEDSTTFPLKEAARHEYLETAQHLVGAGADVNAQANDGKTPLMTACEQSTLAMVKFLVEKGAKKSLADNAGKTALDYANEREAQDIVVYLQE